MMDPDAVTKEQVDTMAEGSRSGQGDRLGEPFPKEMLRHLEAKNLTYVPIAEVVTRLNNVLGTGAWNMEVMRVWSDQPDWVLAHVRLSGMCDGVKFSRDGVGGQKIKTKRSSNEFLDLGDDYKGAVSDALKKASQLLGVGIELARTEEALELDRQDRVPKASPGTMEELREAAKVLPEDERRDFITWWNRLTGDGEHGKRFDSGDVTVEEAERAFRRLKATSG